MKIFSLLILVILTACGKPAKRHDAEDPNRGIWFKNNPTVASSLKVDTPFFLADTSTKALILRVRFDYTTKNVYTTARILTLDKAWVLSINNYRVIDCTGPDRYGFNNCRVEFIGVPEGTYLFEY